MHGMILNCFELSRLAFVSTFDLREKQAVFALDISNNDNKLIYVQLEHVLHKALRMYILLL